MLPQPSPEGPVGRDFDLRGDPAQFDADPRCPPPRVASAEVQDRRQRGRVRAGATAASVITGDQAGVGLPVGLRPPDEARQIANRAQGQAELPGDLGRSGPDANHPGDGQSS
jgi:hypothetical protein